MNIKNLLTVKSLVTLALTLVFAYLAVARAISADQFMTIFAVIISFYFGTQKAKDHGGDDTNGGN